MATPYNYEWITKGGQMYYRPKNSHQTWTDAAGNSVDFSTGSAKVVKKAPANFTHQTYGPADAKNNTVWKNQIAAARENRKDSYGRTVAETKALQKSLGLKESGVWGSAQQQTYLRRQEEQRKASAYGHSDEERRQKQAYLRTKGLSIKDGSAWGTWQEEQYNKWKQDDLNNNIELGRQVGYDLSKIKQRQNGEYIDANGAVIGQRGKGLNNDVRTALSKSFGKNDLDIYSRNMAQGRIYQDTKRGWRDFDVASGWGRTASWDEAAKNRQSLDQGNNDGTDQYTYFDNNTNKFARYDGKPISKQDQETRQQNYNYFHGEDQSQQTVQEPEYDNTNQQNNPEFYMQGIPLQPSPTFYDWQGSQSYKIGGSLIKKNQQGSKINYGQKQVKLSNGKYVTYSPMPNVVQEKPLDNSPDKFLFGMLLGSKAPTGIAQLAGRGVRWIKNNIPYWDGQRKVASGQQHFNLEKSAKFSNQKAGRFEKFIDMVNPFM